MSQKTRRTTDEESNGTSRRRVLRAIGAGATAMGVTGMASAQQGGQQQPKPDIVLGGEVKAWHGRKPKSIQGKTNPTLNLQAGKTYTVKWKNMDGQPHNFALQDKEGNNLKVIEGKQGKKRKTSQILQEKGATQTVQFTPTKKVSTYICTIHPTTMVGEVKLTSSGGAIKPGGGIGSRAGND